MTSLPSALLQSLAHVPGFDKERFEAVHTSGIQVTSVRGNPIKLSSAGLSHLPVKNKIPWSSYGYYLTERPAFIFDPHLHAGQYYVQEASSMFLEQALKQSVDLSQPLKVLDLCAAPGGKSTLIQSLISTDSVLVSNEVIKQRSAVLEENIIKWGGGNVVVTNNDPAHFARLENYFDVMVIDAPCSGSGLFRRDPEAIEEWSENNVQLCSQRQQRIIADAWPALKEDGVLIYSTCSYSAEEDENILDWLCSNFQATSIPLQVPQEWNIIETISPLKKAIGYRFYPDKLDGEGFFIAVIRKNEGGYFQSPKAVKAGEGLLSKTEAALVKPWIKEADWLFYKQQDAVLALPSSLHNELAVLKNNLYIKYAGIAMGKLSAKDLIPDHALAVSNMVSENLPKLSFHLEDAIRYLRKDEVRLDTDMRGWALAAFEEQPLGWIKILPNRSNNYYPKEWRILKAFA
ncbi:MAG: RNA methyltransferase [Chitinophagaceae bacterium]